MIFSCPLLVSYHLKNTPKTGDNWSTGICFFMLICVAMLAIRQLRYCENMKGGGAAAESLALEVTSGLKSYFESACGPLLLYKEEREQYNEITDAKPDVDLASIYGMSI